MLFPKCTGYSSGFKIYSFQNLLAKMCRFRVNERPIHHIFHRFQNVPASCERCRNSMGDKYGDNKSLPRDDPYKKC